MAYGVKIAKGDAYKRAAVKRRHIRVRKNVSGTPERPRLVVTRSNRHIVAQIIDDIAGHTLASASTLDTSIRGGEGDKSAQASRSARWSPSVPRPPASRPSSSTAVATGTPGASPRWPTPPAKPGSSSEPRFRTH